MSTIDETLKAIECRVRNASKGPWKVQYWALPGRYPGQVFGIEDANGVSIVESNDVDCDPPEKYDAEFIAHARTDIPFLLDWIKELTSRLEEMTSRARR